MKKLAFILILLSSCLAKNPSVNNDKSADSLNGMSADEWKAHWIDSVKSETINTIYYDTVGVSHGPIQIVSKKVVEREYSTYKDVRLTYKNVSGKRVSAIRFRWYGVNAFGEPADMSIGASDGFGGGFDDGGLGIGKTTSGQWSVMSRDAKKIVTAWAYEVAFEDGSKWQAKSN